MGRAKGLIVRFSSIGDIVLTSPVVRCLREQTGAEVHFLTKAGFAGIVELIRTSTRSGPSKNTSPKSFPSSGKEGFTQVIDLHRNLRTRTLSLLLWQPKYYRFNKLNWPKYLLTRWKVDRMPNVHIVDRYLETVRPLGVTNDGKGLDYFTEKGTSKVAKQKLRKLGDSLPDEAFLAFVIGAAHATKRLTEGQMIGFCQSYSGRILLLGGPRS